MIKTPGLQAYTLLALQGAVWGSSFQAIKYALEGFGPISIAAGRILIAALVLRETVGFRRWTAVAIGFVGVLIVTRPGRGIGLHDYTNLCRT